MPTDARWIQHDPGCLWHEGEACDRGCKYSDVNEALRRQWAREDAAHRARIDAMTSGEYFSAPWEYEE